MDRLYGTRIVVIDNLRAARPPRATIEKPTGVLPLTRLSSFHFRSTFWTIDYTFHVLLYYHGLAYSLVHDNEDISYFLTLEPQGLGCLEEPDKACDGSHGYPSMFERW